MYKVYKLPVDETNEDLATEIRYYHDEDIESAIYHFIDFTAEIFGGVKAHSHRTIRAEYIKDELERHGFYSTLHFAGKYKAVIRSHESS